MTDQSEYSLHVNINLYTERRMKREDEAMDIDDGPASSPYFENLADAGEKSKSTLLKSKSKDDSEQDEKPHKFKPRQTLLSFASNGQLSTRKPLINPSKRSDAARKPLKEVAAETKILLPGLLATRPDIGEKGYIYKDGDAPHLDKQYCPNLGSTQIRVINSDTIDTALSLLSSAPNNRYPCVLNMANAQHAGGGWEHGSLAQEEALCYRTTLSKTLKKHYYPLADKGGIYSPFVLVIRNNMKTGHDLMDLRKPADLPVISVVSVAAVCIPQTTTDATGLQKYALSQDRRLMEEKMRVILRIAAKNGHRQIVLGAFGCGAFANPREEVARMWKSVLREAEFAGGWWSDVVFAVLDDGRGNLQTFQKELDGMTV